VFDVQPAKRAESRSTIAFSAAGATLILMAVAAFWKPYFSHPTTVTEPYVHLHVFFVALWMSALVAQPLLVRARRFDLHRAIGRASFVVAPLVGVTALLLAHSRFSRMDDSTLARSLFALYLPLMAVTAFLVSYGLAVAFRRHRGAHAAFMVGTALALVDPILVRLYVRWRRALDLRCHRHCPRRHDGDDPDCHHAPGAAGAHRLRRAARPVRHSFSRVVHAGENRGMGDVRSLVRQFATDVKRARNRAARVFSADGAAFLTRSTIGQVIFLENLVQTSLRNRRDGERRIGQPRRPFDERAIDYV
jgi:hypothetical protein